MWMYVLFISFPVLRSLGIVSPGKNQGFTCSIWRRARLLLGESALFSLF